ncbi:Na(+)/H(+) antiporter subunit D [Halocatena pleomorpha]|uniref:Na(+)/H(+) antiporter subunit D n=1 Tax=Halocatena pleomorpha TaxID=1785090 RepID=A0A3P3RER2_9EURY|nr:Na(+)/H(+) antiporter subunit D [Halocatena pleomorpha]RRJ31996.1 Na(+)/H(+) antiporter subunit D [Halocatena pleomorpha]
MVDPIVPPFVPVLAVALIVPFIDRRLGHALGVLTTGVLVPYVWLMPAGQHLPAKLFGFDVVLLNVDPFSTLMGIIFAFIGSVAVLYSWASEASSIQTAFALGYVGTSLGAVFGGDWLTLIFFWELMAVTSTLLVWYYGGRAVRAGYRYALLHGIGGTLLLGAVVWHYVLVGSFLFTATAGGLAGDVAPVLAGIGIGVNVGFVGLHAWLPDTYPRPHIAASVFLCVYTTKTGVYGMYRAFPDGQLAIAYMGGLMAVFGAGMALLQNDMRRLLSYHIQSQVGYMIAGVGIGGALATGGAFGHVFNHILYKSLLFMTVGVVIYRTGEESLKKIGGLGRKMPITAITFTVAALSISGFPGFNGFVSKGMVLGAAHKKHLDVLWYLLLAGGVGTFLSFIKLGYSAFVEGTYDGSVNDANRGQSVAMVLVAGLCVLYGLAPSALFALLPTTGFEYTTYTLGHVGETLALAAIAVVGFVFLKQPLKRVGRVPDIDRLYNPLALYGTRGVVLAVTELYAAIDRVVVASTRVLIDVVEQPGRAVGRLTGRENVRLEASIGTSVLLVTLVLIGTFAVLVV